MKKEIINALVLQGPGYGIQFWGNQYNEKILEQLLKDSAKTLVGVKHMMRSSPEAAMAIAGLKPMSIRMKEHAKKQLDVISTLDDKRLSKQVWNRDTRDNSIKAKWSNFPSSKPEIETRCQEYRMELLHNIRATHPYTTVGPWSSNKEEESCQTRNAIRCGCDTFSLAKKLLPKGEVMHCPLCSEHGRGVPQHHPYVSCEYTRQKFDELANSLRLVDGQQWVPGADIENFRKLLTPDNWDKQSNKKINSWCQKTNTMILGAIACKNQPSLAALVDPTATPILNSNIVGEVFVGDLEGIGNWKGIWRFKVTDYNELDRSFDIDSTRLDVCSDSQSWFTGEQLFLNEILANGHLTHVPKTEVVYTHQNIDELKTGFLFTENMIERKVRVISNPNRRNFTNFTVTAFDRESELHSLHDEQGNAARFDLNKLWRDGLVETPPCFLELVEHLVLSSGHRSRRPAARSMPKGKTDPLKID